MTQSSPGSLNPFAVTPHADPQEAQPPTPRSRHMSLPLRMDDGEIKTVELPAALSQPSQFTPAEFERLARAYAEALGLLKSEL